MDDFGTIIYIIFTIIAIVFSIIKKSNQKRQDTPAPSSSNDPFDEVIPDFEQLFKSEKGETEKTLQMESVKEVVKPTQAKTTAHEFQEKMKQMESKMSRISSRNKIKREEEETSSEESKSWFNARQAIIYSEILKRPDF